MKQFVNLLSNFLDKVRSVGENKNRLPIGERFFLVHIGESFSSMNSWRIPRVDR